MTQDELELIYNYLHENYEYRDGELIRKIAANGRPIGEKLGTFSFNEKWKTAKIKSIISINKKRYSSLLAHFIWIFHFKHKPRFIDHIDGNIANTRIENLKEISTSQQYLNNTENSKGVFKITNGKSIVWRACIHINKNKLFLGHHESEEMATNFYNTAKEAILKQITNPGEVKEYINKKMGGNKLRVISNKYGFKGVRKNNNGAYYGRFTVKGRRLCTDSFDSPEEAHAAYLKAKEKYATAIKNLGDR